MTDFDHSPAAKATDRTVRAEATSVLVSSIVLTLLIAAPVLLAPSDRMFGTELIDFHPDAYMMINAFEGPARVSPYTQPATDWLGVGLAKLVGGVAAYNILVLATFPLAALFTFLLGRRLGLERWTATFAALAFSFAPLHIAHSAYHPHIAQIQWFPAYFLALWLSIERWTLGRGLLLSLAAALLALSNFYAGLIGLVITPVALPVFWMIRHRGALKQARRHLTRTALTLVTCVTLGGVVVFQFAHDTVLGPSRYSFPYEDLFTYCARWWSYLVPAVEHPFLGGWAQEIWRRHGIGGGLVEQQVFLGWSLIVLAGVAAFAYLRGERRPAPIALVPALSLIALVALVFSLPPEGRFQFIPRPSALLHHLLPMFRAHARFGLVVQLMVFLLAAAGLSKLLATDRLRPRIAAFALVAIAVLELTPVPPWRWHWVLPTEAHRWADEQSAEMKILDCARRRRHFHHLRRRMKQTHQPLSGRVADCAEPSLPGKLAARNFTHVLVHADYYLSDQVATTGLEPVAEFPDSRILAVTAPESDVYVDSLTGFSWREIEADRTFRWMGEVGALVVMNSGQEPVDAMLEIGISAFPRTRRLTIRLNGERVSEVEITTAPTTHRLGPLRLIPGRNELGLKPDGKAVVADDVLHNGDLRELTLAVWSWAWQDR